MRAAAPTLRPRTRRTDTSRGPALPPPSRSSGPWESPLFTDEEIETQTKSKAGLPREPRRSRQRHLRGWRAGRKGLLRAQLSRSDSRLGVLGSGSGSGPGAALSVSEGPGDAVTRTPARSAARAPGASEAPRTPWEPRRGLEEGRDERDLSEFIIDCESHHPLSGALKETMAGLGRCISKRAGPGTTPLAP